MARLARLTRLTREEKELQNSYKRGEWESVKNLKKEISRYQEVARATFRKDKRINIRISTKDLEEIQKRALEEGIPYQTLISSILHKYVSGTLVRKET